MLTPTELKQKIKDNIEVDANGCWVWQRCTAGNGYGGISIGKQKAGYVHRVSYSIYKGEIPKGMVVMHNCDNPPCCNPEHLRAGTQTDNMQDAKRKGRMVKPPVQRGAANNKTKLTQEEVAFIVSSTLDNRTLAAMFNVTAQAIRWRKKQHDNP